MKKYLSALICIPFLAAGCLSSPKDLTRSHARLEKTAKGEFIDLDSHKDVKVEELERVAPDGTRTVIRGYQSRSNDQALEASSRQYDAMTRMSISMQDSFNNFADKLAEKMATYMSGGAMRPTPIIQVVTNYVTVPSTNAVPR